MMCGTVVDYSSYDSCVHYIKILSGEDVYTIYPSSYPLYIRMGIDVEFDVDKNICNPLNK